MSTFPVYKLTKYYLVPLFTEWLTPPDFAFLYNAFGKNERETILQLQFEYPAKFQDFILSLKENILAFGLWTAVYRDKIVYTDSIKRKTLNVGATVAGIANHYDGVSSKKFLNIARNFERIKIDIAFMDRGYFVQRFAQDLLSSGTHIIHLDISGVITTKPEVFAHSLHSLKELVIECPNRQALHSFVVNARQLHSLKLKGPKLTSRDLCILGFHGSHLVEYSTNIGSYSDIALRSLMWFRGSDLRLLSLDRAKRITDKFTEDLIGACPYLKSLSLSLCDQISDDGMRQIFDQLPMLESMSFWHNASTSSVSLLDYLRRCTSLQSLRFESLKSSNYALSSTDSISCVNLHSIALRDCNLTDEVLMKLLMAQHGIQITTLDISRNPLLSASTLANAVNFLTKVRDLNISYCTEANDTVAKAIASGCNDLVILDLTDCQRITEWGVNQILKHSLELNTLLIEYLNNCDIVQVIDCIINNSLVLRKIRMTNGTGENYIAHETRLREFRPTIDVFVRTSKAKDVRDRPKTIEKATEQVKADTLNSFEDEYEFV